MNCLIVRFIYSWGNVIILYVKVFLFKVFIKMVLKDNDWERYLWVVYDEFRVLYFVLFGVDKFYVVVWGYSLS